MRRHVSWTLALLLLLAGAAGCTRGAAESVPLPALRPLDAAHAAEFVQAFDAAKDLPRYVVALSPT